MRVKLAIPMIAATLLSACSRPCGPRFTLAPQPAVQVDPAPVVVVEPRDVVSAAPTRSFARDSAEVTAAVARFHHALEMGDSAAVLALLAPDAVILESGGVEYVPEYRGHHLPADIEFARAVQSTRTPVQIRVEGDVAWASATSVAQGQFRGRAVNSAGAELMVLARTRDGWRITAIHWSSRTRR
ncbi:nuclear transport factor 2 family protein [Longimicrobium sp.]|uniref:YybH family protein n=1 Tax=Longimicrobium sp. TaxID=2029185 RepID=UPI002F950CF2